MKEYTIYKNDQGQRYDRFLQKLVPLLPAPLMQKYFRLKRFKCNGKAVKGDYRLCQGDVLQLYINDEFFQEFSPDTAYLSIVTPQVSPVYEDEHIIFLNKPSGVVVHHDENGEPNNLLSHLQAYLYQKREWKPREEQSFAPSLCNRIDRNTSGIVIAAKTAQALRVMNEKIKERQVKKEYLCIVHGSLAKAQGKLEHYLLRDTDKKQVYVYDSPTNGAKTALTHYDVLAEGRGLSLIRCELHTGRTHQIRAQLAHVGHPLLGDGKYGSLELDRPYGKKGQGQALCSYRLSFPFTGEATELDYLKGKFFQVDTVDFVEQYFPEVVLKRK